jgi:hypothetical protein
VPILCVGGAVANAITVATGKPTSRLPLTPPRVLGLLHGREPAPALAHIAGAWRDNVLTDADVLLAAASG